MTAHTVRSWAARSTRRGGLAAALAAEGLLGGGSVTFRDDPIDLAGRLRRALDRLGPVPRAFGRHLATRVELLPGAACRTLAGLAVEGAALDPGEVTARIEAELGRPIETLLEEIDPEPLSVDAFRQRHRARTRAGRDVEVVLARPEAVAEAQPRELEPLGRLLDLAGLPGGELLADFHRFALAAVDLETEAQVLSEMSGDPEAAGTLAVPPIEPSLSRGRILVHGAAPGLGPDELAALAPAARSEAVGRVALAWLRQALFGRSFPLTPAGGATRLLADGRVAFVSGPFGALPASSRESLWKYLEAGVAEDPTAACERLLPELVRDADGATEGELLLRLRQVVAFRDGGLGEDADPLADHLFTTLRVARELGYRARRPAADLVRGLVSLTLLGLERAPGSEPVRRGVEELRLQRTAADLRSVLGPAAWKEMPAPYATLLLELPRKVDAVLDLVSRGEAKVRLELVGAPRRRASRGGFALALGAVALALTLAAPRLAELLPAIRGGGGDAAEGVILALLAAVLVMSLMRRR